MMTPLRNCLFVLGVASHLCTGTSAQAPQQGNACEPHPPPAAVAPRDNLWLGLSFTETDSIQQWLCKQPLFPQSNWTRPAGWGAPFPNGTATPPNATTFQFPPIFNVTALPCEYRIGLITALSPNKSEALAYLDGKTNTRPRHAQVPVFFQRGFEIYQRTYAIGPLPISDATKMQPMYTWTRDETKPTPRSSMTYRPFDFDIVLRRTVKSMEDIVADLLGSVPVRYSQGESPHVVVLLEADHEPVVRWTVSRR